MEGRFILMMIMLIIFIFCAFMILLHLIILPAILIVTRKLVRERNFPHHISDSQYPCVTILVTCFNEGDAIRKKAENLSRLDYPKDRLQIIFAADGSKEDPRQWLKPYLTLPHFNLIHYPENRGKIPIINDTVSYCKGEVLVFTDVDALLDTDSLKHLIPIFQDPDIGGACGLHRLRSKMTAGHSSVETGQKAYWNLDTQIKQAESRLGSISSCYGTLYAIRCSLFTCLPSSVTDDAFQAMGIVRQKKQFVFVPDSLAYIDPPSKNYVHEVKRRRRIILRSLRGLWISRELFNPLQYGSYAFRLLIFKVIRRLTPVFMVGLFVTNLVLSTQHIFFSGTLMAQIGFYLLALAGWKDACSGFLHWPPIKKGAEISFYYCMGNAGTLLGIIDFLSKKQVDRWSS